MRTRHSPGRRRSGLAFLFVLFLLLAFLSCSAVYLKSISTDIAVSDACDVITAEVNTVISDIMQEGDYDADYFVSFEKSSEGEISAISCNMARINALSSEILERIIGATDNYTTTVKIPLGNLTGVSLLMGRGPMVPIDVVTLTSSRVDFSSSIVTAGINQTRHQINLEVMVDIDILVPWGTESTRISTEVLIADTVIVGQVPDTYLSMEG